MSLCLVQATSSREFIITPITQGFDFGDVRWSVEDGRIFFSFLCLKDSHLLKAQSSTSCFLSNSFKVVVKIFNCIIQYINIDIACVTNNVTYFKKKPLTLQRNQLIGDITCIREHLNQTYTSVHYNVYMIILNTHATNISCFVCYMESTLDRTIAVIALPPNAK